MREQQSRMLQCFGSCAEKTQQVYESPRGVSSIAQNPVRIVMQLEFGAQSDLVVEDSAQKWARAFPVQGV